MAAAAQPLTFDDELRNFGSLVGLVLVFVVLFTNQRWTAAAKLDEMQPPRRSRYGALLLNLALPLVTAGLFAAGMPLVVKALEDPQWLRVAGAIRDAFILVWVLAGRRRHEGSVDAEPDRSRYTSAHRYGRIGHCLWLFAAICRKVAASIGRNLRQLLWICSSRIEIREAIVPGSPGRGAKAASARPRRR